MEIFRCFSKNMFLSTLLLLMCLQQGLSLRCYNCYSISNIFCNDPFIKNSTASKEYGPGSVCVKLKGDLKNGDGFVLKREGMPEKDFDEILQSKLYPDATLQKCSTDLCNHSGSLVPSLTAAHLISLGLTVFFFQLV